MDTVRAIFDTVIEAHPVTSLYLSACARIVRNKEFESAIVKVIDGAESDLTEEEKQSLEPFKRTIMQSPATESPEKAKGLLNQAMQRNKRRKVSVSEYVNLKFIPPTSNIAERLFSNARLVLTDYRKSMDPYTFECLMFLKSNRKYWDLGLVANVVNK